MNKNKIIVGVLIVGLVIALGILAIGKDTVIERTERVIGNSPDVMSPYLRWGNVEHFAANVALATATTTPCAIQSPSATSTLVRSWLQISTASSTATTWTAAKAATAYATTTSLGTGIILASGAQGTMTASTTFNGLVDDTQIIAPNNFIVWGVAGIGNLTTDKLLGRCGAEFVVTGR